MVLTRRTVSLLLLALVFGGLYYASQMAGLSPALHHGANALLLALIIAAPILMIVGALRGLSSNRSTENFILLALGIFFAIVIVPKYWNTMIMHARAAVSSEKSTKTECAVDDMEDEEDFDGAEFDEDYEDQDEETPVIIEEEEEEVIVAPVQATQVKTTVTTPKLSEEVAPQRTAVATPTKTEVVTPKKTAAPAEAAKGDIAHITTVQELNALIKKGKDKKKPVVVKVYATWCGPCKMMAPHFEKVAGILGDKAILVEIDSDQFEDKAMLDIQGFPTIKIWKDGKNVDNKPGFRDAKGIEGIITPYL